MTPEAFRAALAELDISAERLARRCGRSACTGQNWRNGKAVVPAPVAAWLLRRLAQRSMEPPPKLPPKIDPSRRGRS
jgi:transcriptional regulator with XRE-family HTH domain